MLDRLWVTGAAGAPPDGAVRQARRPDRGEAVVIVDVDQFRAIRERHGAQAAEQATRAVADCLRRRLRGSDRLALVRDDEFLAVLHGAPAVALDAIAGRLRGDVNALRLALAGSVWALSCTVGRAARDARPCGLDALVRAADLDLDRARRGAAGRCAG